MKSDYVIMSRRAQRIIAIFFYLKIITLFSENKCESEIIGVMLNDRQLLRLFDKLLIRGKH